MTQKKRNGKTVWRWRCRSKTCHSGCLGSAWKSGYWKKLFSQPSFWMLFREKEKELEMEINSCCHVHPLFIYCWKQGSSIRGRKSWEWERAKPFLLFLLHLPPLRSFPLFLSSTEKHLPMQTFSTESLMWEKEKFIVSSYWTSTGLSLCIAQCLCQGNFKLLMSWGLLPFLWHYILDVLSYFYLLSLPLHPRFM